MNQKELEAFEAQQPFYKAFFGHRIAPSHLTKSMRNAFKSLIETLIADLTFYHKDVEQKKLREALIIALTVMHRLQAKHPNVYTGAPEIGMKAFKHADRFLQDNPLPLPPVADDEEVWDAEQHKRAQHQSKIHEEREKRREESESGPSEASTRRVSDFLNHWRETGEFGTLGAENVD